MAINNYYEILNNVPSGACIINKEQKVIFWNKTLERRTGILSKNILNKKIYDVFPKFQDKKIKYRLIDFFESGVPIVFSTLIHKNLFELHNKKNERYENTTVVAIKDPESSEIFALFTVEDVTELVTLLKDQSRLKKVALEEVQKKIATEIKLKDSEEKFRTLAEISPNAIFITVAQRVIYHNQAASKLLDMDDSDIFNNTLSDLLGDSFVQKVIKGNINTDHLRYELEIETKLNNFKWIDLAASIFKFKGEFAQIWHAVEITNLVNSNMNLQALTNKLEESNSTKDKFFSIIAHDLKNPLSAFKQLSNMLSEEFDIMNEIEKKESIQIINHSAVQVYNLLENLLEWSNISRGKISFNPSDYQLNLIIENVLLLSKSKVLEKKLELISNIDPEIHVFVDANMITTVVRNLVSNAMKFTANNGKITISSKLLFNDFVEICIEDTGIGISESDLKKLFRIDVHYSSIGTSNEHGTGLGLILCKEFVEIHDGTIRVESTLGQGSKFIFTIPSVDFRM